MRSYWRIAIILGVIVVAALGNLLTGGELGWLGAGAEVAVDENKHSAEEAPTPQTETFGPADAPITIKAFYTRPGFDADKTLELLKRFVELYEPGLRVEFVDSSTQMGIMARGSAGLKEDGLTLNGRNEFARIISGELRTIRFLDAPYPYWCKWREADLHAFVRNELQHLNLDTSVSDEAIAETGEDQTFTVGNPNSPVKVVAYYPMSEDCVDVTFTILREVADAYRRRHHVLRAPRHRVDSGSTRSGH